MSLDMEKIVRSVVDLGSESYEQRMTRVVVKAGCILLFVIVVWRFLK